jgi:hypothetical protein
MTRNHIPSGAQVRVLQASFVINFFFGLSFASGLLFAGGGWTVAGGCFDPDRSVSRLFLRIVVSWEKSEDIGAMQDVTSIILVRLEHY